jgi:hypothetical protein
MKEYRLSAWPDLSPPFHRTAYRRMASDMSQRYMTVAQLADVSGLKRMEVKNFVEMLEAKGLLRERECMTPDAQFWSLRPLGGWLRRAISTSHSGR